MTVQLDLGARCDAHVGEVFSPRCPRCDQANRELEQQNLQERHERALQRNAALGIPVNHRPQPVRRLPFRQRR